MAEHLSEAIWISFIIKVCMPDIFAYIYIMLIYIILHSYSVSMLLWFGKATKRRTSDDGPAMSRLSLRGAVVNTCPGTRSKAMLHCYTHCSCKTSIPYWDSCLGCSVWHALVLGDWTIHLEALFAGYCKEIKSVWKQCSLKHPKAAVLLRW